MIKIDNVEVTGWEAAIRGMRNPMDSWSMSDTYINSAVVDIGPKDQNLMSKLIRSGTEHRKFLRMIHVQMDITAPLYWWKEYDTYKVATVANSCSTMHRIHSKEFTQDDFSCEHLEGAYLDALDLIIRYLNIARKEYNSTKDKSFWWQMIQLLPSSYNQKRTVDLNYETVLTIIRQRSHHKLDEWRELVDEFYHLPYVAIFMESVD